jgi:hypothetical protein
VLIAAFIVKSLPLAVRWLVVGVVLYAALSMLRSAAVEKRPRIAAVPQNAVPDGTPPVAAVGIPTWARDSSVDGC